MRAVSWVVGALALLASGGYVLVYVYRWEWHRALLVGILFLAALIALCAALVLRRLDRVERRLREREDRDPCDPLLRLRTAPVEHRAFRWLRPEDLAGAHIFVPVLIGGGVLVSAAAWVLERVAGASARAGVEEQLATQLRDIAFPRSPLAPTTGEAMATGASPSDDPGLRLLLGPSVGAPPR